MNAAIMEPTTTPIKALLPNVPSSSFELDPVSSRVRIIVCIRYDERFGLPGPVAVVEAPVPGQGHVRKHSKRVGDDMNLLESEAVVVALFGVAEASVAV